MCNIDSGMCVLLLAAGMSCYMNSFFIMSCEILHTVCNIVYKQQMLV